MHVVASDTDDGGFRLPSSLDGLDQWDVLSDNRIKSRRSEILHNIDPNANASALRVGDMKVVLGIVCIIDLLYGLHTAYAIHCNREESQSCLVKTYVWGDRF